MLFLLKSGKKNSHEIHPEEIFIDSTNISNLDSDSFEGRFEKNINVIIFIIFGVISAFLFSFFIYKLYMHQVYKYDYWNNFAMNNYIKKSPIFPARGIIKDRNGETIAWNEDPEMATSSIPKRFYITSAGLSSTLGYMSYPKKDKSGVFWQDTYKGQSGLEKQYNDLLSGVRGEKIYEVSVNGKITNDNIAKEAKDGADLETYIDINIQKAFYKYLKEVVDAQSFSGGAGIMMDVNSGQVLALASYPDYDNNLFSNAETEEEKDKKNNYLTSKKTPMLNRAVSGVYVPGSVVKPFMAYAALNVGVIDQYQNIFSSGKLVIKNKYDGPDTIFRDWKAHGYVDARHAIAVSSDEYFYQVGGGYGDQKGLGIDRIEKYMKGFGFASSTGIDLPLEKIGVVPSKAWKEKSFEEGTWLLGNTYHTAIGQYGFQTSPISLARSVAIIANGGKIIIPKIASTTENNKVKDYVDLKLNKDFLKVSREGMALSASEIGTAHYFNDLPFTVAAKTGTAQLGLHNERVNSWSAGYFPRENPKYVFVFMMEGGPATNKVGASKMMRKVFSDILEKEPDFWK